MKSRPRRYWLWILILGLCAVAIAPTAIRVWLHLGFTTTTLDETAVYGTLYGPDGTLYTPGIGPEASTIVVQSPDGTRRLLRGPPGSSCHFPAVTPDGQTILFTAIDPKHNSSQLWRIRSDGTGLAPFLTSNTSETASTGDGQPAISPDGKRVVFVRAALLRSYSMGGMVWDKMDLWEADIDGSNPRQITFGRYSWVNSPTWSPDGTQLVVGLVRSHADSYSLYTLGLDATGRLLAPRRLEIQQEPSSPPSAKDWHPRFTPSGRLVFVSNRGGNPPAYNTDIWICNADGSNPQQLTTDRAPKTYPLLTPAEDRLRYYISPGRQGVHTLMDLPITLPPPTPTTQPTPN